MNSVIVPFKFVVVFLVPAVVWTTLVVGLYQLVRDGLVRGRIIERSTRKLTRESKSIS